jgi:hypothetical protein
MNEASDLGFTRLVGGKRIELKGSGEWFPQVPNSEGVAFLDRANEHGLGNDEVKKWADGEVTAGRATDADAALARLLNYRDARLRNVHPYFESSRLRECEQCGSVHFAKPIDKRAYGELSDCTRALNSARKKHPG